MTAEIPSNIVTVDAQKQVVHDTYSLGRYFEFSARYFANSYWPIEVDRWAEVTSPTADHFRLFGLIGIICAQYGFPSIDKISDIHLGKRWKKPPQDARHQLALGVYTSDLAIKATALKEEIISQIPEDTEGRLGVWGIFFKSYGGEITRVINKSTLPLILEDARDRLANPRKIALPDKEMNRRMKDLGFTGDDADRMPDAEFETQVLPRVVQATEGWIDPIPVFTGQASKPLFTQET